MNVVKFKLISLIKSMMPHAGLILSGIFVVLLILDGYNPTMNFIDNQVSHKLFWIFCICSIFNSVVMISSNRKEWRKLNEVGKMENKE
jgi:hypothetical protein